MNAAWIIPTIFFGALAALALWGLRSIIRQNRRRHWSGEEFDRWLKSPIVTRDGRFIPNPWADDYEPPSRPSYDREGERMKILCALLRACSPHRVRERR